MTQSASCSAGLQIRGLKHGLGVLCWMLTVAGACWVWAEAPLSDLIAARISAERARRTTALQPLLDAQIQCGPWYTIGPMKDAVYGVFGRAYATEFEVEADLLARGSEPPDLSQLYQSVPLPGAPDGMRRWMVQPAWSDGYYHQLPSGPPPGRNEVTYLYRAITCAKPVEVTAYLVTLDAAKVWIDGQPILDAPIREGAGQRFLRSSFRIPLHQGENRLLVKIVKCFQHNGFSFAIDGLHAVHPLLSKQLEARNGNGALATDKPFSSAIAQQVPAATEQSPAWYLRRGTWRESLTASRAAAAESAQLLPFASAVLRQNDGPRRIRLRVAGRRQLVLISTVGGDNYDYDDSIWADPKLIDLEGREVWLTDLTPVRVDVGFAELFVNQNHAGRPLTIGSREFERGFWAHAPSVMVFDLEGEYEWFETWFGLDALAVVSGTTEFVIGDSIESAQSAANSPDRDVVLKLLLMRDFPAQREEIDRELAAGIWDGIDDVSCIETLSDRYESSIREAMVLPPETLLTIPRDIESLRALFHSASRWEESLRAVREFRFEIKPQPSFDPPELAMQQTLDRIAPTAGGARYLARLEAAGALAQAAWADYESAEKRACETVPRAAAAIQRFLDESILAVGPIVFVRRPSFGATNAIAPYGTDGRGPASIVVFDPHHADRPPRVIHDEPEGTIWQASLSFDAQTILFAAKRPGTPGGWQIYEIGIDGHGLRAVTSGDGNNVAPIELPDGQLMFVSDRAGNNNVCQPNRAGALYVCRRDGTNVRRVSANTLSDHTPAVMDDGRVMFTRWDYGVDKGVFQRHGVWTMNPDGSHLQFFFGNTVLDPNAFWQCVPVPHRPEVVSTFGGHHNGPYGVVGLLWNRLGIEAPRGVGYRFLTREYPTYFDDNFWHGYVDPHPLNEHEFLVSYGGGVDHKNRIYWLDTRGNRTCIWEEAGEMGCFNPLALRPRERPPVIPAVAAPVDFTHVDQVVANINPDDSIQGTYLVSDVYEGLPETVARGEIKALQIMELVPKTRSHTGGYAWNISPTIGRGTFYVRRLIGTVGVEEDGSAYFSAPALRDISFNVLDAKGRVLQKMGSTTQIMPGEQQSCIGCHEHRGHAAPVASIVPQAARRPPSTARCPDWGTRGIIDYVQVVQPVWDRHCVRCHGGPRPDGNLDLSGDKTRYFNMSYDMLIDRGFVHHIPQNGADQDLTTPEGSGSLASRLVLERYLESGHYGVELSADEFQRVHTWIDANVPYYHTYLYTDGEVNGARCRWYDDVPDGWFQRDFAPVFMRRCFECHKREVDISDAWLGRRRVTVTSKVWSDITLMDQGLQIESSVATFGPEYRINLTHPEWSQMLTAPLAKEAGGLGICRSANGEPVFRDATDLDYRTMLQALRTGQRMLELNPRVDMLPREDPAAPQSYAPSLQRPRLTP